MMDIGSKTYGAARKEKKTPLAYFFINKIFYDSSYLIVSNLTDQPFLLFLGSVKYLVGRETKSRLML